MRKLFAPVAAWLLCVEPTVGATELHLRLGGAQPGQRGPEMPEAGTVTFNLFGDVLFSGATGVDQLGFSLGQLDFFAQGALTKRFSVIAETVIEVNETDEWKVEGERYQVNFDLNDHLQLRFGRVQSAYGYYNMTYYHAEWMATQIKRPLVVEFEDLGGLLPVHLVGLQATGRFPLSKVTLGYGIDVANGRGPTPEEISSFGDTNLFKAVNLLGYLYFPAIGLRIGGNFSFDRAPPVSDPEDIMRYPMRTQEIAERIYGGHLAWEKEPYQLLAEYYQIRHRPDGSATSVNDGYFVIASYGIGDLRPFVELSTVHYDQVVNDLFFSPTGTPLDSIDQLAGGFKYWLGDMLAIKLAYAHEWHSRAPDRHIGMLQLAFGL